MEEKEGGAVQQQQRRDLKPDDRGESDICVEHMVQGLMGYFERQRELGTIEQ